jgi:hypothetical protein
LMPRQASFACRPNRHNGETPKRTTCHNTGATRPHRRIHRAHHERLYIEPPSFQSARKAVHCASPGARPCFKVGRGLRKPCSAAPSAF